MSYQRQFNLKYNPDVDRDVIEALERSGSPVDYVRRLVRERQHIQDDLRYLRHEVWLTDIQSSNVPEYIEHHRDIQYILKCIDGVMRRYQNGTTTQN